MKSLFKPKETSKPEQDEFRWGFSWVQLMTDTSVSAYLLRLIPVLGPSGTREVPWLLIPLGHLLLSACGSVQPVGAGLLFCRHS